MDNFTPLGSLEAFKGWSTPRPWGPSSKRHGLKAIDEMEQIAAALDPGRSRDRWHATFGPDVVADLAKGIREHRSAVEHRFSKKAEAYPIVLGCVSSLTSREVVDALLSLADPSSILWPPSGCCLVLDKAARAWPHQANRLMREGFGVPFERLHIEDWGVPGKDGRPPVIDPGNYESFREQVLDPVRVVGWNAGGNAKVPVLHAKLAVCCAGYSWDGEMGGWEDHLLPMSVWMGSANWSELSRSHLEFGAWTTDPALVEAALEFMVDLITTSEPWWTQAESPSPELVRAEWDNEAFAEYAAEFGAEDYGDEDE